MNKNISSSKSSPNLTNASATVSAFTCPTCFKDAVAKAAKQSASTFEAIDVNN